MNSVYAKCIDLQVKEKTHSFTEILQIAFDATGTSRTCEAPALEIQRALNNWILKIAVRNLVTTQRTPSLSVATYNTS